LEIVKTIISYTELTLKVFQMYVIHLLLILGWLYQVVGRTSYHEPVGCTPF